MTSFAQHTIADFLAALAAPTPAPGGGAAAAVSGATAAALVEMVAGLSLKKSPDGADAALQQRTVAQMATIRGELLTLADDDAAAYDAFIQAMRLPKSEEHEREERARAMSVAAERAAEVPLHTLRAITSVAEAARLLTGRSLVKSMKSSTSERSPAASVGSMPPTTLTAMTFSTPSSFRAEIFAR